MNFVSETVSKRITFMCVHCSILIGIELTGWQAESWESSFGQTQLEKRQGMANQTYHHQLLQKQIHMVFISCVCGHLDEI